MQIKQQIEQLLSSAGLWPKKRLGQNFLIDLNLMRLLIDTANINGQDVALEVGCGTGSFTEALAEKAGAVIAVEIDKPLAQIAQKQLEGKKNVLILNADILDNKHTINSTVVKAIKDAREKHTGRLLLAANLPYNVACPVMMNLITGPELIADAMYVTVQKEVADRMTAGPGDRHYGQLSILMSACGQAKMLRVLKPTVFWPQPQVNSAMLSFIRDEKKAGQIRDIETFCKVISLFMGHRRKMLKACTKLAAGELAEIIGWDDIFEKASIVSTNRPEQISPQDYVTIANLCIDAKKG